MALAVWLQAGSVSSGADEPQQPETPITPQTPVDPQHAAKMAKGLDVFKKHVRPVLISQCVNCHGGEETESEFDLTTREGLLRGGAGGTAVVPGKAEESRLYKLVMHQEEPAMPMDVSKLPETDLAHLRQWIELGAPYDKPLIDEKDDEMPWTERLVSDDARQFWSFQPLGEHEPPHVASQTSCRTAIDQFVVKKLEDKGLQLNPPAERRKLIRRAYFDLIGLPPTPEEVEQFVRDTSADAYDRLVDRLLDSRHFGERWARHWLDVARFAESHGFEQDYDRPYAYHFRDFVIKAFNADMPYDQFVRWQLAGDELRPDEPLAMMATGFLGAGVFPTQITAVEVEPSRYDALDDMAATTGTAMLGLTVGCARCHDHKFDPIPQADYYRFLSTFTTTVRSEIDVKVDPETFARTAAAFEREHEPLVAALNTFVRDELPKLLQQWEQSEAAKKPDLPENIKAILAVARDQRTGEQTSELLNWYAPQVDGWKNLKKQVDDHAAKRPRDGMVKVMVASEGYTPIRHHTQGADFFNETFFLKRGDIQQKQGPASQGFLQVLMTDPAGPSRWQPSPPPAARTSFRRAALSRWMTDTERGAGHLLARVIVNRLWQHHLGRGIVATPSDFGSQGQPPTHPELLDWLAARLIQENWRLKPIHKLIMTSAVYMQSSDFDPARQQLDPDNMLYWRREPQRLEAEVIRDAMLAASGSLDPTMYGPGTLDESHKRRSIYFMIKRSKLIPVLQLFDAPEPLVSIGQRPSTTIAPQALLFMNNPQVREYAVNFAKRISPAADRSLADAVAQSYLIAIGREPTAQESQDAIQFLQDQTRSYEASNTAEARQLALADFCQTVMALNEFIYIE